MARQISVVIPTCKRSRLLQACLKSLEQQTLSAGAFEAIVVLDGPDAATLEFLKTYRPAFSLKYLQPEHKGVCAARNLGIQNADSDLILCLDDDIVACPRLLSEHLESHASQPGCLVQGALEPHVSLTRTPFIRYQEKRLRAFRRSMKKSDGIGSGDISAGNISFKKSVVQEVGGFNENLKHSTNTDGELAYRFELKKIPLLYNSRALGYMLDMKDLDADLQKQFFYGCNYVDTQKEFPETIWKRSPWVYDKKSFLRNGLRFFILTCSREKWDYTRLEKPLRATIGILECLGAAPVTEIFYRLAQDYYFWKGVDAESGGDILRFSPKKIPVLCYHNISDLGHPAYWRYILPVKRFKKQMVWLKEHGYQSISLGDLYAYMEHGAPIPSKPVLITFDDGYRDLKTTATPFLAEMGLHHTHFINAGKMGKTTDWVKIAPDLPILSREDIQEMSGAYGQWVDFQAHGDTHLSLKSQSTSTILKEIQTCIDVLEPLTQKPVHYFAYPYGDYDDATVKAIATTNLRFAFTVARGLCQPGQAHKLLPRVEIFAHDLFLDFILSLSFGWSPIARLRGILKKIYKKMVRFGQTRP